MTAQIVLAILCFWPIAVIGVSFLAFLREKRLLRFSLRTLLIATTLVAVGLGLIVWLR